MARGSRMSVLKRQRELKKAEKAARKRAKRHDIVIEGFTEPQPTIRIADLVGEAGSQDESAETDSGEVDRESEPS